MNTWAFGFDLDRGNMVHGRGDVTTLSSVFNRTGAELETRLGFRKGRLDGGWALLFLIEPVQPTDFIWGDVTKYSGGMMYDRDAGEYVPVIDLKRAALLNRYDNDRDSDRSLYAFQLEQARRLNVRHGPDRICKVVPCIKPDKRRVWYYEYPDSPIENVPQWTLLCRKHMKCGAVISRTGRFSEPLAR